MIPKPKERSGIELLVCTRCKKQLPDESRFCPYCGKELFPKRTKARRPNGSGSVYKMPGRRARPWAAQVTKGAARYYVGSYPTSAEAMKALALYKIPEGGVVTTGMTLAEVYEIVIADKERRVSQSSIDTYRAAWKHLSALAHAPINELKAADYQRVIDGMEDFSRSS